jgi:hypothetical protein
VTPHVSPRMEAMACLVLALTLLLLVWRMAPPRAVPAGSIPSPTAGVRRTAQADCDLAYILWATQGVMAIPHDCLVPSPRPMEARP